MISYKTNLIQDICKNEEIVKAIDSHVEGYHAEEPDTLVYRNIFPFINIENTQTSSETYILLGVDHVNINRRNDTLCDIRITIMVLAHNSLMKMKNINGTRTDYIANELRKLFNGQEKYGFGKLHLASSVEDVLNENYQYRRLIFETRDRRTSVGSVV